MQNGSEHVMPTPEASVQTRRVVQIPHKEKPRYDGGWRREKPVEDPEKVKRWGFVTAKPSEFLIHMRRGKLLKRSSGQGASCFKRPWDSVAIIPTSINRLQFAADQVTREKVGVEVLGLAVFRIVSPLITYRMLNFSFTERASEKLEEILQEMFVGATRRLVANLTVEEVLTRRKDALAGELMAEIAPIVQGSGRPEDANPQGWGVVLDTIEIQDVRVLSERVFSNMQAEFRAELQHRSRAAQLEAEKAIALREASNAREEQLARLRVAEELNREKIQQQERARMAHFERQQREAQAERSVMQALHENQLAEAQLQAEREREVLASRIAREAEDNEAKAQIQLRKVELERSRGQMQNDLLQARRIIENSISDDRIRLELVQKSLPAIAQAFAQKFGEVHLTQIGAGGSDPNSLIAGAIAQVMEIARASGIDLTRKTPSEPEETE